MSVKGKKYPPEPLSREEVDLLIGSFSRRASTGIRNRAIVAVLWRGAMRIGETLSLKVEDLDVDRCTVRVLHGKGNVSRVVVIDRRTVELVECWLKRRAELGIGDGPMFCTLQGGEMDAGDFRKTLKMRAARVGIRKRVHPHGLRHTGASDLASEGYNLQVIQEQLGHRSASTTDRYLRRLSPVERIECLNGREW